MRDKYVKKNQDQSKKINFLIDSKSDKVQTESVLLNYWSYISIRTFFLTWGTLIRQRSVTLRLMKFPEWRLRVSTCVLKVQRDGCLIKAPRLFKVRSGARDKEAPVWWMASSTSLIFLLKAKWTCLSVSVLLVNCSAQATSGKWMTKWAYHLQQLLTAG